jgi:hypothetical protein
LLLHRAAAAHACGESRPWISVSGTWKALSGRFVAAMIAKLCAGMRCDEGEWS